MNVEKKRKLHDLIIRISEHTGDQVGAAVTYVQSIVDTATGETYGQPEFLPPEPLALGADALTPLIGEVVRAQQVELEALRASTAQLTDDLSVAQAERDQVIRGAALYATSAEAELADLKAIASGLADELSAAQEARDQAALSAEAAEAQLIELHAEVERLTPAPVLE